MLFLNKPNHNSITQFSFKLEDAKSFNLSYNSAKGHLFRIIVAHDGLTLRDLYACNGKNNAQAWPWGPSDGGSDDNDSSGVMRYCSIRYSSTVILPNKEINGLSLCAVGRGTKIENIEVFDAGDDSVSPVAPYRIVNIGRGAPVALLDFIDTLWTNRGGFYGNWTDDVLDCEYTYYGLLALGHLSL